MVRTLQVVLPSFNEEVALGRLFPQFEDLDRAIPEQVRVLVVDDGSSDGTAEVAGSWQGSIPVSLIRFPENRGYGAALAEGVKTSARELAASDLIATMDADDTHSPSYLREMIGSMDDKGLDVVIASRYAEGGMERGVPFVRRVLSRGAGWFYRRAFHLPNLRDYSCGYRLFKASLIQKALADRGDLGMESGFQATGELLLRLREQTTAIGEVGFELHYERKPTPSKMHKVQTIIGTLRFLGEVRRTIRRL